MDSHFHLFQYVSGSSMIPIILTCNQVSLRSLGLIPTKYEVGNQITSTNIFYPRDILEKNNLD